MLLQALPSQEDHISRILKDEWRNDIIGFLRPDLPRLLAILLLAFIFQRVCNFFVSRILRLPDRPVGSNQTATVTRLPGDYPIASLPVSVDAGVDADTVLAFLRSVADEVRNDPAFKQVVISDPDILRVNDIRGREVIYPVNLRVRANQKD